jgi:hypothetical protein
VSAHSLLGLAVLNLFVLVCGAGLLWGIRGWATWGELVRLSGFAYMLGVAALGVSLSIELVVGVPFSLATIVVTGLALAGIGLATGRFLGRARPTFSFRNERIGLVATAYGALLVVYLESLFRAGRLSGLYAWDAWAFWVPKAKAIYFFGGLDEQFFTQLPNPTYPPLVPALEASAFHFMGSADVVTLHVQFWFFLVGFVTAALGLLSPRVPQIFLWPVLLAVLTAPRIVTRALEPQADFLLDYLFALAALLVALWLLERRDWQLVSATLLFSAAMLTKREGLLLVACVVAAALVASCRDARRAWPKLVAAAAVAFALELPWRVWFESHDLRGELPESGFLGLFEHTNRGWPAFESVLRAVLDFGLWSAVLVVAAAAIVLAVLAGARLLPAYAGIVYVLAVAGFTWVLWSFTELELPFVQDEGVNPIVRLVGSLVILSTALVPLLLTAAWRGSDAFAAEPRG